MTDKAENTARVRKVVGEHLGLDDGFDMDASLEDLGADSLDRVELTMAMEEEFGIAIADDVCDGWSTPNDMIACTVND